MTIKSSLVEKIVAEAKALGELNYRSFLVKEQLKTLHVQTKDDSFFLKRKPRHPGESWRAKDMERSLRDHRKSLIRMGYLEQQELDQIQRLAQEVEDQMKETMSGLLEHFSTERRKG